MNSIQCWQYDVKALENYRRPEGLVTALAESVVPNEKSTPRVLSVRDPKLKSLHAEIGALILSKWSFPDDFINAVRWQHNPEGLENSNLHPDIVYLASLLCHSKGDRESDEEELNMPYSSVLDRLDIESEQYEVFAEKARNWMKKLSDNLTFD